ncbi:MAG: RDD family protein [Chitinophagaceae bacterium]
MGAIKVPTNFNIELEFEVPEFYKRLLSLLIDIVIQYFYIRIAIEIHNSIRPYDDPLGGLILTLLIPVLIYHPLLEITMNGQSIGKKVMGLRVVDELGGKPSISQFLIRWLLRLSDLWIVIVLLIVLSSPNLGNDPEGLFAIIAALAFLATDIVLVVSSKKGQRIGDILAKTILISIRTKSNIEETVFQEVADNYVPSFPQIMQLSDKDINAIKSILETARKKGDYNMAEAASSKIKAHLKIESDMAPFDFLETLLKDYNYLSVK